MRVTPKRPRTAGYISLSLGALSKETFLQREDIAILSVATEDQLGLMVSGTIW
jgi:hypothetical protein